MACKASCPHFTHSIASLDISILKLLLPTKQGYLSINLACPSLFEI